MNLYDFIFTKQRPACYYRHIAFWTSRYLFSTFDFGYVFSGKLWNWNIFSYELRVNFIALSLAMVYCYTVVYYFYPVYLSKKKYFKFFSFIFGLTIITYAILYLVVSDLNNLSILPFDVRMLRIWHFSMSFINIGPPVVCCLFLVIKMLKNYYLQMEKRTMLAKEIADAELQLLKSQVHPHFLFNTLNNIYSSILNKSSIAKGLLTKLSDTLRYMIYDCEAPLVSLDKELKMIEDYTGLEKVRYGERLNMEIEIKGDYQNKLIAPLLLIPFVENCFKHGSSKMLQHPWIKLKISIRESVLDMDLGNSKPMQVASQNHGNGIGLKNVQKRLQILYPGRHKLLIQSTDEEFSIHLQVPLYINVRNGPVEDATQIVSTSKNPFYA
ncbi:MAG TPA: histidine kinase [Hanamia sp.]|nr:histidine kinase [Hanamia sp.]